MAHLTVPPRFLVLLPELLGLHAQGLNTKAPGFALLFFPDSEIRADPQIGSQLGIFPGDQRAEGEPFGDGGGVDGLAVLASGKQAPGPIDLPDAGFDRPSLALSFSDALVGLGHLLIQIKHEYLRGGIVDCSADNRAG